MTFGHSKLSKLSDKLISGVLAVSIIAGMLPAMSTAVSAAEKPNPESRDGYIGLEADAFNIHIAIKSNGPVEGDSDNNGQIDDMGSVITSNNTITMGGTYEKDYRRDTVSVTSKYSIDWSQSFELQGYFTNNGVPDGMTITFHNDPNFDGSAYNAGGLGVYKGVKNGAIFEIDTYNNGEDNEEGRYSDGSDASIANQPLKEAGSHLGFSTTDSSGKLATAKVGTITRALSNKEKNTFVFSWNVDTGEASITLRNNNTDNKLDQTLTVGKDDGFAPETLWGTTPVYMTISSAMHQKGNVNGLYELEITSFKYTGLTPKETVRYLVYRDGVMSSEPVVYDEGNQMTWPMPGDKVVAEHTMQNEVDDVPRSISVPIRVPLAQIATDNGDGTYTKVQALTPTDLSGTTSGSTNIFNGEMAGAALSTATFTFPQTNLMGGREAVVRYTYTIPQGTQEGQVIEDKVIIGSPIMTQYAYHDTVKLGGLPTASAPDMQLKKGSGTFDLKDGLTYADYGGTQNDNIEVQITNEAGKPIESIDTSDVGTYKITYTVTDNRFHNAVTSFVRTITVTDGAVSPSGLYAVEAQPFSIYLSDVKSFDKTELIKRSGAIGYNPDGTTNSDAIRFVVTKVNGEKTDSLDAIKNASSSAMIPVTFYYRTDNEEDDRATITINVTIVDNNAAVSPNNKNTVNANNVVAKSADVIKALAGDVDNGLIKLMGATATIDAVTKEPEVSYDVAINGSLIGGVPGDYEITFKTPGTTTTDATAEKTVTLSIVPDDATLDDNGNAAVSSKNKVINVSEAASLTSDAALRQLMDARAYANALATVPSYTINDGKTLADLKNPGTYTITWSVPGVEGVEYVSTLIVVDNNTVINGENVLSVQSANVTYAYAQKELKDKSEGDIKTLLKTLHDAWGSIGGNEVLADQIQVTVDAGPMQSIREGTPGTYDVTFTVGSGAQAATKTVKLTIGTNDTVIKGPYSITATDAIVTAAEKTLVDNRKGLIDIMKASGTKDGVAQEPSTSADNNGYTQGTVGQYEITFVVGTPSDPDDSASKTAILQMITADGAVSADRQQAVWASKLVLTPDEAKELENQDELKVRMKAGGWVTPTQAADEENIDITVNNWNSIKAGVGGDYNVTFTVGNASKTVVLVVGASTAKPEDGKLTLPSTDGVTDTNDDVIVKPEDQYGNELNKAQIDASKQPDGSYQFNDKSTITLPGPELNTPGDEIELVVDGTHNAYPNGVIKIPEGSTGHMNDKDIPGPAVVYPDGTIKTDTDAKDNGNGSFTVPGKDGVMDTDDDVTAKPDSGSKGTINAEEGVDVDGPGKVEIPGPDGTNGTEDDGVVSIDGPHTVNSDGTITVPQGSIAELPNGDTVQGPAIIKPDGTVADATWTVTAKDFSLTVEEAKAIFNYNMSTAELQAVLVEKMEATAFNDVQTAVPTAQWRPADEDAILTCTLGSYRITFVMGTTTTTVLLTIAEENTTPKGSYAVKSISQIVDQTTAKALYDTNDRTVKAKLRELLKAEVTLHPVTDLNPVAGIELPSNINDAIVDGTIGLYTIKVIANDPANDPQNSPIRPTTLNVMPDGSAISEDGQQGVIAKDGILTVTKSKQLVAGEEMNQTLIDAMQAEGYITPITPADATNMVASISEEDMQKIMDNEGWEDLVIPVTFTVGGAAYTANLTIRSNKPHMNDNGTINMPGKDEMTYTDDDPVITPDAGAETVINKDGTVDVGKPGGSVNLPLDPEKPEDDVTVDVDGPFAVLPDGTVKVPGGSQADVTGVPNPVTGPATVTADGKVVIPVDEDNDPATPTVDTEAAPNGDGTYEIGGETYYPNDSDGDGVTDSYVKGTVDPEDGNLIVLPDGKKALPVDNNRDGVVDDLVSPVEVLKDEGGAVQENGKNVYVNPETGIEYYYPDGGKPYVPRVVGVDQDLDGKIDVHVPASDPDGNGVYTDTQNNNYVPTGKNDADTNEPIYVAVNDRGVVDNGDGTFQLPVDKNEDGVVDATVTPCTSNGDGTYTHEDGTLYGPVDSDGDGRPDYFKPIKDNGDGTVDPDPENPGEDVAILVDLDGDDVADTMLTPVEKATYPAGHPEHPGEDKKDASGNQVYKYTDDSGNVMEYADPNGNKVYAPYLAVDTNNDGVADTEVIAVDPDGDGIFKGTDGTQYIPAFTKDAQLDKDLYVTANEDGVIDNGDGTYKLPVDSDGDGKVDKIVSPCTPNGDGTYTDKDENLYGPVDSDGDGKPDYYIPIVDNGDGTTTPDTDGDGVGDGDKGILVDQNGDGKADTFVKPVTGPDENGVCTDSNGNKYIQNGPNSKVWIKAEQIQVDTDGDGVADKTIWAGDPDGNGLYTDNTGKQYAPVDTNGDGKPDYYLPMENVQEDGSFTAPVDRTAIAVDTNGDGKADNVIVPVTKNTDGTYQDQSGNQYSDPNGDKIFTKVTTGGGGGTGPSTSEYTLTYESNGGTVFAAEKYASGTEVKLTKIPRRDGYIFTGWYSDAKLTQRVTSVTMQKNVTVYAGWEKAEISNLLNTKDHMAYIFGYDDGLVHPNNNMTRAETAMVLFRLLNEDHRAVILTSENSFSDVNSSNWYNEAVSTLANGGYINGYPDGTFGGDNPITRMEFVSMLVRVLGVDENAECSYTDVGNDLWAYRYIATAKQAGWVNGFSDGSFRPEQPITRAEAMAIFNRILNRGVDETSDIEGYKVWSDNQPSAWYYYEVIEATTSHEYTGSRPSEDWTHVTQD